MNNTAEWLLASIGVSPIISSTPSIGMPYVGIGKMEEAVALPGKISSLIARALSTEDTGTIPVLPTINYRKALDEYATGIQDADKAAIIKKFADPSEAPEFILELEKAFDYIKSIFPISEYNSFTGPRNLLPTSDKIFTFLNQLSIIDDVCNVIKLMGSAALLRSQVRTVNMIYPEIAQYITQQFFNKIGDCIAAKKSYQVPARTAIGLTTWLAVPGPVLNPIEPVAARMGNAVPTPGVPLAPGGQATPAESSGKTPTPSSIAATTSALTTQSQKATLL